MIKDKKLIQLIKNQDIIICPNCDFKIYEEELINFGSCGQCGSKDIFKDLKGGKKINGIFNKSRLEQI